jgi:hypothetical protein
MISDRREVARLIGISGIKGSSAGVVGRSRWTVLRFLSSEYVLPVFLEQLPDSRFARDGDELRGEGISVKEIPKR